MNVNYNVHMSKIKQKIESFKQTSKQGKEKEKKVPGILRCGPNPVTVQPPGM